MIQRWDWFVTSQRTGTLFQMSLWPDFFSPFTNHWTYFYGEENNTIKFAALIQGRRIPVGGVKYSILRGPVCDDESELILGIKNIIKILGKGKTLNLRLNPYWDYPAGKDVESHLRQLGFEIYTSQQDLHCQTITIDLSQSEEEIFQRCRKRTRYEIRKAQKVGLNVKIAETENEIKAFYRLLRKMERKKNLRIPGFAFILKLWTKVLKDQNLGILLMTYFEDRPVSGVIILRHGDRAVYSWGASEVDLEKPFPKNHWAIWKGILWAKAKGCRLFDLGGFTGKPGNPLLENIDLFKRGFGGDICQLVQSHQFIIK